MQDRPDRAAGHKGVSILLVEKVPGFTVSKDLPKLGYKGVESCELVFDDYRASRRRACSAASRAGASRR